MKKILFIGNGFDLEHGINISFKDFVDSNEFKSGMRRYKKFFIGEKYNENYSKSQLWSEFENFCFDVSKSGNVKKSVFYKKISFTFSKWIAKKEIEHRLVEKTKPYVSEKILDILKINFFAIVSLNFTNTLEKYGFESKMFAYNDDLSEWTDLKRWKKKFIKIHYFPSKQNGNICIIGHDQEKVKNKNWLISDWGKKEKFNHKIKVLETIENNSFELYFYGFSFGKSDSFLYEWAKKQPKVIVYWRSGKARRIRTKKFTYCTI